MSVLENSRAKNVNMNPFAEKPQPQEQPKMEQNTENQVNNAEITPKPQENSADAPKITLENYADKEFVVRTMSISKNNLAFIKVMSKLEHLTQQDYLDKIINEYKNGLNLGEDIKQKIQNQQKAL